MGKKIEDLKNYRLKYKRYYGVDLGSDFDIHHIDFNHSNNDIDNLLLLPKKLHAKYHMLINELGGIDKAGQVQFNVMINMYCSNYQVQIAQELCKVMVDIKPWIARQKYLQSTIKNKEV